MLSLLILLGGTILICVLLFAAIYYGSVLASRTTSAPVGNTKSVFIVRGVHASSSKRADAHIATT